MITATDLKIGTNFLLEGRPFRIVKYSHSKLGRGGATVHISARNMITGNLETKTFNSTAKFDEIITSKKTLQYLYKDNKNAFFMDPVNFNQLEIPLETLGSDIYYLTEGGEVDVLFLDEKPLNVELPPKIVLKVTQTVPGVKGNSATNIFKPATLENGLEVKVPLFIKVGDKVRVDTRDGKYIERVN
jgi:elongation factor P